MRCHINKTIKWSANVKLCNGRKDCMNSHSAMKHTKHHWITAEYNV